MALVAILTLQRTVNSEMNIIGMFYNYNYNNYDKIKWLNELFQSFLNRERVKCKT